MNNILKDSDYLIVDPPRKGLSPDVLDLIIKKELTDIQEWFLNKANMTSDYWLVQIDSQENSKIERLFSSFILQYTSLVFPFHYSGK